MSMRKPQSSLSLGRAVSRSGLLSPDFTGHNQALSPLKSGLPAPTGNASNVISMIDGRCLSTTSTLLDLQAHPSQLGMSVSRLNSTSVASNSSSFVSNSSPIAEPSRISSFKRTMTASAAALESRKKAQRMHTIEPGCLGMTCSRVQPIPSVGPIFTMNGLPYRKRLTKSRLGFRSWRGRDGENAEREDWLKSYIEEAKLEEKLEEMKNQTLTKQF